MISLIVPTRNRAYALEQVLDTFYLQSKVTAIIFIDDCSEDNTFEVVSKFQKKYPLLETIYLRNSARSGAAFSRARGVKEAKTEYILFCDDDEFLELSYAEVCLDTLIKHKASIVSGRHFYRQPNENIKDAIRRFGNGLKKSKPFDLLRFKINLDASFEGDIELPFTHGIYLAKKALIEELTIDPIYAKGNGFREESDLQMMAYSLGHKIVMTNSTHCVHMHQSEVRTGGQRVNRLERFYWTIYYTNYFFNKYFSKVKLKLKIPYGKNCAITIFFFIEFYYFFIRPFLILPSYFFNKVKS